MRKGVLLTVLVVVASFVVFLPEASAGTASSCASGRSGDFDGDGNIDLAIGAPKYDANGHADAGIVNVIYGSGGGLVATGSQLWMQGPAGSLATDDLQGAQGANELFGACLATGDFDGDGNDDLAVGTPFDTINSKVRAGSVSVIYGSGSGLVNTGNQLWTQDSTSVPDQAEKADRFGSSLAAGDFDGDGKDDLAIGVPFEGIGSAGQAGAVNVLYGSGSGLSATGAQFWAQGVSGVIGHGETGDHFGLSLATGDFNNRGRDDLAIGVPGEDHHRDTNDEGVVQVLYSNVTNGLMTTGQQLWHENTSGVAARARDGDQFGASLAAADFNNDTFDDLAIGVPLKDTASPTDVGGVHVLYGTTSRLDVTNNQFFMQGRAGVLDTSESGDHFGATLAAADFNGDGFADLAIGIPLENLGTTDEGAVDVIYGTATVLDTTTTPTQQWKQGASSAGETGETGDTFGAALASGDYNGDTFADLAIGVPREDHAGAGDIGGVQVLYGVVTSGLDTSGHQVWWQDFAGVAGPQQISSLWGAALG